MGKLFDVALEWLTEDDWRYTENEHGNGDKYTRSSYSGSNSNFELVLDAKEEIQVFFVYVYFPLKVPEKHRLAVSELITRINYGLKIGNFEFDMNDGDIRYKASVDVEGSDLVTKMIHNMVMASLSTSNTYVPAVMHICYGNKTAVEALDELSNKSEAVEVVETETIQ
ncbi:MAG: YbjN domain-containing protein [Moraxellaceae bacterium]|nr:YbjN domain-containing protein [Moraxellaceae bacterium]